MHSIVKMAAIIGLSSSIYGCAIYYHDSATGADHIWGFGHLAMKSSATEDGKKAEIQQATLTGFAVGIIDGKPGLSVGWDQRERIQIYDENTALYIERPANNDFFMFKIGSYPPNLLNDERATSQDKKGKMP